MLQSQGFGSRKHCQQLIKNGAVTIHGEVISDPKFKLDLNELTYPQQKLPSTKKYNNLSNVDKSSTFIVPVEQDGDDYIITFPDEILQKTGWKIGDTLNFENKDNGTIVVTKVK